VENVAVATSGDAWQYVEILGQRYSHILDPRTGRGLTTRSSVSVVAPQGMAADSLASAVSVLGRELGLQLIEATPGAAAIIVHVVDGKVRTYTSKRLGQYLMRP
jgi:thiamine biosynthesis lipoprotein